uniref:Tubby C-terminal domain-containing protein n=1 Tax=Tetraselmis chuii TaxID=63592 RepID=A0A7S1SMQ6_9CHLO|mmetsp:Transcript_19663/g.35099  ORF Transcript_19663/g.35099 Transcript_19663/m.35099 type:complete len:547 (+) Transcript_19663:149-1789(+)|eukprot:CAMPEP_0177756856 /NCGR_PEP_ID=MMETSP0491_2-20121128/3333_1 /TAXON_ID=63592 /ORGANISM="Tetraselmis chuii, Strain PLY429" /LENGTH=546 /DNA_ID=CAMNT_0019272469 /DNA_START=302 /DNA_END=1942 /DNA_ORIENTATION=-
MFLSESTFLDEPPEPAVSSPNRASHPTRPASARRRSGAGNGEGSPAPSIPPPDGGGRQVYNPGSEREGYGSRPGTASLPVRPVSAASWNRAMSSNRYSDQGDGVGIGGDVLADPAPRPPGSANSIGGDAQSAQARLQQQRNIAQQKRAERLQGGIAHQTLSPARPGSAVGRRPGTAQSRPGTGQMRLSGGLSNMHNLNAALNSSPQTQDMTHSSNTSWSTSGGAPAAEDTRADDVARDLARKGLAISYDPNEGRATNTAAYSAPASAVAQLDLSDMRTFLMRPGPRERAVQCYIVRDRSSNKMYPKYTLYMNDNDRFMLSARKRKKSKTSNYLISLDEDDTSRNSGNYFGKLRSNFMGTEFTMYDKGAKPGKSDNTIGVSQMSTRCEMGAVLYQYNVMGVRGPRKMTACIPDVDATGKRKVFKANLEEDEDEEDEGKLVSKDEDVKDGNILSSYKKGESDGLVVMKNKPPKWNESLGAYCLNFNGRVTHASVKNFQLVSEGDEDHVILQFGKVGKDTFTMDFAWPICATQAFSICLTSFDNKLACE